MKRFMLTPKITLLTIDYPPMKGGVARYLSELVEAAQGEIQVIVPKGHGHLLADCVTERRFFWSAWPAWLPMIQVMLQDVPREHILLISHVIPVGTAAWIASFFGGPKYALLFHGTDILRLSNSWKRWLVRRICERSQRIIVNSRQTRRLLVDVVGEKRTIDVVTPGVTISSDVLTRDEARKLLNVPEAQKIVISVARLVKRKGIDTAIRVMARLNGKRTEKVHYVVIGDGPEKEGLQKLATELHVDVMWEGEADDETKWKWLSASDVFLLPGSTRKDDIEGFGIVLVEAGFAGLPVVAGKTGGTTEAVIEGVTGWMFEPEDVQKMMEAIERVIDRPVLGIEAGQKARDIVQSQYQWEDRWQKVRNILLT